MKIILYILIMVVKMCGSESSVYDWYVKTIESGSDFGNDLKMQTALNNERQQDLFKMSGKTTNNKQYYPNSFYTSFHKNNEQKNNEYIDGTDDFFKDNSNIKHKGKTAEFQPFLHTQKQNSKAEKSKIGNENNYDYDNDRYNKYETSKIDKFYYHQQQHDKHPNDRVEDEVNDNTLVGQHEYNKQNSKNINGHTGGYGHIQNANMESQLEDNCAGKYEDIESFVGTNLFDSTEKKCFSTEDVALLTARKDFEDLIPKNLPQCLFDDHMVALLLNYFYISHQMIMQTASVNSRNLLQKAFYDTLGGYLNFYVVPVTKYSYYSGQVSLSTTQRVLNLHQESKQFLNTNGNGWKAPLQNVLIELKSVHIEPLHIPQSEEDTRNEPSFCMQLDLNTDDNHPDIDNIIVPMPTLEAESTRGYLGNIWLPFRRKRTFDLKAESSNYIVVKFYETVTKCYRFENIDQEFYDQQFQKWLLENINIHLSDEEFYPGLGAVLRIYEYLKGRRKNVIGIGNDLSPMEYANGMYNTYRNYEINSEQLHNGRRTKHNEAKETYKDLKEAIENHLKESHRSNGESTDRNVETQIKTISGNDNKLQDAVDSVSQNSTTILQRFLDLPPLQMATIIGIPVVAIIIVIIVCCCVLFFRKKKSDIPTQKHSSSSSSNLFNSPVRFFHIRKKSASNDASSNEASAKKNKKKSVKIEKKPLMNSDSSASGSPVRSKKSKESTGSKRKNKDSDKSNSKSSWETTYSSK